MRGLLMVAAITLSAATPAAANWGYYQGASAPANYGYANYGAANYGTANYGYAGYGYGGYGYGYANLSQHGAGLPHWGNCPCCAGAWDGYCEEKAARAANRRCNTCGTGCGHRHFGRKCGAKGCNTCGANGDCGCANGAAAMEAAPTTEEPAVTPPPPTPDAAPDAAASTTPVDGSISLSQLPGVAWLLSLVDGR